MERKPAGYIKLAQIALSLLLVAIVSLILLSAVGTLATASMQSSISSSDANGMVIRVDYSFFNPGPIALSPLRISLQLVAPDGELLSTSSNNSVIVNPFSTSSGSMYFNLTYLPGADQRLKAMLQNGQQPIVNAKLSSDMDGIVQFTISLSSNGGA